MGSILLVLVTAMIFRFRADIHSMVRRAWRLLTHTGLFSSSAFAAWPPQDHDALAGGWYGVPLLSCGAGHHANLTSFGT